MRRLVDPGMLLPLLLAVAGVILLILGQMNLDGAAGPSLPPIPEPTATQVAVISPTPSASARPSESLSPTASPTPSPTPSFGSTADATQLQVASVGINVRVFQSQGGSTDDFPGLDGAYILSSSSQPGRGTNSYIFAHARLGLFKNLWNVQLGAEVLVKMSDGAVLRYVVSEIHPNVACPDDREPPMPADLEPLALKYAPKDCSQGGRWLAATDHERLTLQTSQGYNRNWGELIVIADPVFPG